MSQFPHPLDGGLTSQPGGLFGLTSVDSLAVRNEYLIVVGGMLLMLVPVVSENESISWACCAIRSCRFGSLPYCRFPAAARAVRFPGYQSTLAFINSEFIAPSSAVLA